MLTRSFHFSSPPTTNAKSVPGLKSTRTWFGHKIQRSFKTMDGWSNNGNGARQLGGC